MSSKKIGLEYFNGPGTNKRGALMPDHWDIQRFSFFEKRQMFRILWVEVLVDRCDFQSAKSKFLNVVDKLIHTILIVWIDRTPADKAV